MYNAIIMTDTRKKESPKLSTESFNIDIFNNSQDSLSEEIVYENYDQLFLEAVFSGGKATIKPMEDKLAEVKKILMDEIHKQEESEKSENSSSTTKFDPKKFWKIKEFKELENVIKDVFGFRAVQIIPYIEKYDSKSGLFESKEIQCSTYMMDRFPIDGLVTDKGFYDNTHSIFLDIRISLGIIKSSEPGELTAVILHEIGHNIDPAIVSISYAKTNIISKYLTDRVKELSKSEKKYMDKQKLRQKRGIVASTICGMLWAAGVVASFIAAISLIVSAIVNLIKDSTPGGNKDKGTNGMLNSKMMEQLKEMIKNDAKTEFDRKTFSEAFADNFARMYGYGPQLASSFNKMEKHFEKQINSRYAREKDRQRCIMNIVANSLKNVHKTDVHRIKALMKQYQDDINDPNIPEQVKKQLKEDLKEVEEVLDKYVNDFSEFQNNINRCIIEAIDTEAALRDSENNKEENKSGDNSDNKKGKPEEVEEATQIEQIDESRKAYNKMMKEINAITQAERNEFYKIFGKSYECSLAKDKDGYYVRTHRARSHSYPEIKDIPKKDVDFVRSTS